MLCPAGEADGESDRHAARLTVDPDRPAYYAGKQVTLTATPAPGYRVKAWTGTDVGPAWDEKINVVTVRWNDVLVTVEFELDTTHVITVPGDYPGIQDAISAAQQGDTIVVDPGTYTSGHPVADVNGVRFALVLDKAVTVTSRNPDDPAIVAATIIRGPGTVAGNTLNNQGVLFSSTATRQTVFSGFTLENFGGSVLNGGNGGNRGVGHPDGYDGAPVNGSALIVQPHASPTIKNCVIQNNSIVAGNGGNGVAADATHNAGRGGWAGWARGGAIYCAVDTNPKFINCTIENNTAQGGNGGNGGNGVAVGGVANYGGNYTPPMPLNIDPNKVGTETRADQPVEHLELGLRRGIRRRSGDVHLRRLGPAAPAITSAIIAGIPPTAAPYSSTAAAWPSSSTARSAATAPTVVSPARAAPIRTVARPSL